MWVQFLVPGQMPHPEEYLSPGTPATEQLSLVSLSPRAAATEASREALEPCQKRTEVTRELVHGNQEERLLLAGSGSIRPDSRKAAKLSK